jgi:hypothetical protein
MSPRADAPDAEVPEDGAEFPHASELAAFRAAAEGLDSRVAVERYAPHLLGDGKSARAVIGRTRRVLQRTARLQAAMTWPNSWIPLARAQGRGERHESLR